MFKGVQNQDQIYRNWEKLINIKNDITDETVKRSTAIVLENAQQAADEQFKIRNSRGLLMEDAGISTVGAMGPYNQVGSYAGTAADGRTGDARVPSVVIPMIRRIYPNLIAHKLVGVQPMQGPIGMAFAFRAKYGRNRNGIEGSTSGMGTEIGYLNNYADFTGAPQTADKYSYVSGNPGSDQGRVDLSDKYVSGGLGTIAKDAQVISGSTKASAAWKSFYGDGAYMNIVRENGKFIGDGADTSSAENWAVGRTMPEAGFEFLKETVTAKTRKLGVQITRETEEDMKAMQGMNAQNEVSDIMSYEIAAEIDRQLLAEIIQSAILANNVMEWDPAKADGRNQSERTDALYTTILTKSAEIATQSRRGAANWAVCSPGAAALLESHIYNPLGVAGGLGNGNAFGKSIDNGIGVTDIGSLRNGTIKLYRDTLAGGDYILLGYKGNNIYDTGVIYLPYIPLELTHAVDPFTMNPITAARTRYGVTTNLFGAGQFYSYIALPNLNAVITEANKVFIQK